MRSRLITTNTQISTSKIKILGYQIYPDGTNAATLILYNEATSDKTPAQRISAARVAATASKEVKFSKALYCSEGLYADIAGTNAIAFVFIE